MSYLANFDSSVHISEESSNAAIAVPWAIVSCESHIGGVNTKCIRLVPLASQVSLAGVSIHINFLKVANRLPAINVSLAFCMGTDLEYVVKSPIGQPMAQIFFNSFGRNGTLALWAIVVLIQSVDSSTLWNYD